MNKSLFIRIGAAVGAVGLLALVAPIIFLAAQGGLVLMALGAMGLLSVGFIKILPLLGQKLENKVLGLRKAEARANPIEQLQNYLNQKTEQVRQFKAAVSQIGSQIRSLTDMVNERKRTNPKADTSRQESSIQAMQDVYDKLKAKYMSAEEALVQLNGVIEEKKFDYKFAQAGQAAISSMNAASKGNVIDMVLADEAFDSVRDNFNSVFADLDVESSKLNNSNLLEFGNGLTIDVSAIHIQEKV